MIDRPLKVVLACVAASLAWATTFALAHPHGVAAPMLSARLRQRLSRSRWFLRGSMRPTLSTKFCSPKRARNAAGSAWANAGSKQYFLRISAESRSSSTKKKCRGTG